MAILNRLISLYQNEGFRVSTGLNPCHFDNYPMAHFTWLIRDGESHTNGLGIAMQEIYFLECLFDGFQPKNIFIIGNSFGWSTLALSLLNPQAKLIAIDSGYDKNSLEGIELTNRLAAKNGLNNVEVVKGASPQDVTPIIEEHFDSGLDFVFIDGLHTNKQIVLDFDAVKQHANDGCIYLFHDIHEFKLHPGFEQNSRHPGYHAQILMGTPSGIGLLYPEDAPNSIKNTVNSFTLDDVVSKVLEEEVWGWRHRHLKRYKRSFKKRADKLKRLLGKAS